MNKFNYLLFCLFFGLTSFAQTDVETKLNTEEVETEVTTKVKSGDIVAESSRIKWTGYKAVGTDHKGEISVKEGHLKFQDDVLVGGEITIDMTSLICTDIEDEANNKKLVDHLKSADFFNTDAHQTASIKIKKVLPEGSIETKTAVRTGKLYKVIADLTINGITKEINFEGKIYQYVGRENEVTAMARITIDRTDFDIRYGSATFFDNLADQIINDEFGLSVSLKVNTDTEAFK